MSTLNALLDYEVLIEAYNATAEKFATPFLDRFYQNPRDSITDEVSALYSANTLTPAPFNRRDASARVLGDIGRSKRDGRMFLQFNQKRFGGEIFKAVRDDDRSEIVAAKAANELQFQMEEFARRQTTAKNLACAKMIVKGEIHVDVNGKIAETADATRETITFGVSAEHQAQLTKNATAIIGASWATASTKILDHVDNLMVRAAEENVPPPRKALSNSSMKINLRNNTQFSNYISASPKLSELSIRGEVLPDIGGLDWEFIDQMYLASDGTLKKLIPDGMVIFVPEADTSWLQPLAGMSYIPTSIDAGTDYKSAKEVYGAFAYSQLSHNPIGVDYFAGDAFGWVLKEPNAIWQATVTGF